MAVHPWDEPADVITELARDANLPLLMPRFGEPIEPAHVDRVVSWWRELESAQAVAPTDIDLDAPADILPD